MAPKSPPGAPELSLGLACVMNVTVTHIAAGLTGLFAAVARAPVPSRRSKERTIWRQAQRLSPFLDHSCSRHVSTPEVLVATFRDYPTVDGVPSKGDSIDGQGSVVVGGTLYFKSGYTIFGGHRGSVECNSSYT